MFTMQFELLLLLQTTEITLKQAHGGTNCVLHMQSADRLFHLTGDEHDTFRPVCTECHFS